MVDYIGRALVAEALQEWRDQLRANASISALRDLSYSSADLIDLAGAHPGGLAPFFANRPTLLSSLIRDDEARLAAEHRAKVIRASADEVRASTGVWTAALVVGTVVWSENGHARELPLVMRPVLWDDARGADAFVTMLDEVALNPVFVAELRERAPQRADAVVALVPERAGGSSFDPRPVWNAVRAIGDAFGPGFEVRERLLLGAFDDPEQRLVDDLDDLGGELRKSDIVAAVAGDHDAVTRLAVPIPAFATGDRDPFAERGIGDLDDAQFAALDAVATGRSMFIQGGPGFDTAGMLSAIAADGAASGRCILVVAGKQSLLKQITTRLEHAGAGDIAVDGAADATARSRLLNSITMGGVDVDDASIRFAGERLLQARRVAQSRFDALHRTHRPWDVSVFDAVQAIVRLTSTEPAPQTMVRLEPHAGGGHLGARLRLRRRRPREAPWRARRGDDGDRADHNVGRRTGAVVVADHRQPRGGRRARRGARDAAGAPHPQDAHGVGARRA
ncbi:MAG: hypothetical protein NVV57_03275 [Demequina sp.]|nr:hypothetical protein [Demequina sp.]